MLGAVVGRVVVEELLWASVGLVGSGLRGLYNFLDNLHNIVE